MTIIDVIYGAAVLGMLGWIGRKYDIPALTIAFPFGRHPRDGAPWPTFLFTIVIIGGGWLLAAAVLGSWLSHLPPPDPSDRP